MAVRRPSTFSGVSRPRAVRTTAQHRNAIASASCSVWKFSETSNRLFWSHIGELYLLWTANFRFIHRFITGCSPVAYRLLTGCLPVAHRLPTDCPPILPQFIGTHFHSKSFSVVSYCLQCSSTNFLDIKVLRNLHFPNDSISKLRWLLFIVFFDGILEPLNVYWLIFLVPTTVMFICNVITLYQWDTEFIVKQDILLCMET